MHGWRQDETWARLFFDGFGKPCYLPEEPPKLISALPHLDCDHLAHHKWLSLLEVDGEISNSGPKVSAEVK